MKLCACGCGKELSRSRERISKYIKGHNKKKEPTLLMKLKKRKSLLFKDKDFKHKYFTLVSINREMAKIIKPRKNFEHDDRELDYSKATSFCERYDNKDIECVMCFENNTSCPKKCPKLKGEL